LVPASPVVAQDGGGVTLGVAPLDIKIAEALRGGQYAETINIFNVTGGDRAFSVRAEGEIASWLSFHQGDPAAPITAVVVPQRGQATLFAAVAVPEASPNGRYTGQVVLDGVAADVTGGGSGLAVAAVVDVTVNVGGTARAAGSLLDLRVESTEVGTPARVLATVSNTGNVLLRPKLDATFTRRQTVVEALLGITDDVPVYPGKTGLAELTWDTTDALPGDYEVAVRVYDGSLDLGTRTLQFRLANAGEVVRAGSLLSLELVNEPVVGRPLLLRGRFANEGSIDVTALLLGEVHRDGALVDAVSSVGVRTRPEATAQLDIEIVPEEPGEHRIVARVNFDGRETPTRELTFTVAAPPAPAAGPPPSDTSNGPGRTVAAAVGAGVLAGAVALVLARRHRARRAVPA
jgi:hypothetical protein